MEKKSLKSHLPLFVGVVCAVAVMLSLSWKLSECRVQQVVMQKQVAEQQKSINFLMEDNDALKKQAESRAAEAPIPEPQSPVQAVLDPLGSDAQAKADTLKKRYEDILVTYFVLRKCERVTRTDYHVIISALAQEMASINAPGRLEYDIVTSAEGSYKELYSGNKCEPAVITPLEAQYKAFIDGITLRFTPP